MLLPEVQVVNLFAGFQGWRVSLRAKLNYKVSAANIFVWKDLRYA